MLRKIKYFYYIFKWNRTIYTSFEFVLWYFLWLYLFQIPFDLFLFLYYYIIYLALFGLVYPIVYIYNDICDVEKDKLNKNRLKYKPLAAWKVSINNFLWYWIIWIWLWLILASFSPNVFMLFFWIAILFNFFYTKYLKHIFIVENFANAFTHSFIRFLLWIILAIKSLIHFTINYKNFDIDQFKLLKHQLELVLSWNSIFVIFLIVLLHFIILVLWAIYKRYIEFNSNWISRTTLKRYTQKIFNRLIISLTIIYILLDILLLYIKFDYIILFLSFIFIICINLGYLCWKSKILDKILIRIFAW